MTFTHHPIPALGELLKKGDQLNEIGDPKGGAPGGDVSEDVRRLSVRKCGGNGGQCSVRCAIDHPILARRATDQIERLPAKGMKRVRDARTVNSRSCKRT